MQLKNLAFIFFLFFLQLNSTSAQNTKKEVSDPEAKKILSSLKKEYDSHKTVEISFDLIIELPGQKKEVQKGKMIQEGDKYSVQLSDQEIYCDGTNLWIYLKTENEVQINNIDEDDQSKMLSPKDIIRLYENGEYFYAITGERKEGQNTLTEIEFKPLDKKSEYSKMRLSVDRKKNKASQLMVFSKDGSKFTLRIKEILNDKTYSKGTFSFNPEKHNGVRVEDLRIN